MSKIAKFFQPTWRKLTLIIFLTLLTYIGLSQTILKKEIPGTSKKSEAATNALLKMQNLNLNLPEEANGEKAISLMGSRINEVAEAHGISQGDLIKELKRDSTLFVSKSGHLLYKEKSKKELEATAPEDSSLITSSPPATKPLTETFKLHSLPGSNKVIYLDFDGHLLTGTSWNSTHNNGLDIDAPPMDYDGNPASFSDAELNIIQAVWQRVSEDYAPFDVDVTTEYTGEDVMTRESSEDQYYGTRALVSPLSNIFGNYGGIAYVGVFDYIGAYYKPALIFPEKLGSLGNSSTPKNIAEAISHEVGHNLGLAHDGTTTGITYYGGHGAGTTGWAPIMGVGYYRNLTQWSKGEYSNANQTQDDFVIMGNNGLVYRADDADGSLTSAYPIAAGIVNQTGLIGRTGDVDTYTFQADAGTLALDFKGVAVGTNLDIAVTLMDQSGQTIAQNNPLDLVSASINQEVTAGTYYVSVTGTGKGDPLLDGYTNYGSLGWYTVTGSIPGNLTPESTTTTLLTTTTLTTSTTTTSSTTTTIPATTTSTTTTTIPVTTTTLPPNFLSVSFLSPASGANVSGKTSFRVFADTNLNISRVDLYLDGVLYSTDRKYPYYFSINTNTWGAGAHVVRATATTTNGMTATGQITVYK